MKLTYKAYIAASPELLWNILTAADESAKIFYGASVHSTFEVQTGIQYIGPGRNGDKTIHIEGVIRAFTPMQLLAHTVIVGDVYRNGAQPFESEITYTLEDVGFATKLTITHDGWQSDDPSYENTKENWWLMLSNIKTLAETGKPLKIGLHE